MLIKGFTMPYLKCMTENLAEYTLCEVHKGNCGNHLRERIITYKLLKEGYY